MNRRRLILICPALFSTIIAGCSDVSPPSSDDSDNEVDRDSADDAYSNDGDNDQNVEDDNLGEPRKSIEILTPGEIPEDTPIIDAEKEGLTEIGKLAGGLPTARSMYKARKDDEDVDDGQVATRTHLLEHSGYTSEEMSKVKDIIGGWEGYVEYDGVVLYLVLHDEA